MRIGDQIQNGNKKVTPQKSQRMPPNTTTGAVKKSKLTQLSEAAAASITKTSTISQSQSSTSNSNINKKGTSPPKSEQHNKLHSNQNQLANNYEPKSREFQSNHQQQWPISSSIEDLSKQADRENNFAIETPKNQKKKRALQESSSPPPGYKKPCHESNKEILGESRSAQQASNLVVKSYNPTLESQQLQQKTTVDKEKSIAIPSTPKAASSSKIKETRKQPQKEDTSAKKPQVFVISDSQESLSEEDIIQSAKKSKKNEKPASNKIMEDSPQFAQTPKTNHELPPAKSANQAISTKQDSPPIPLNKPIKQREPSTAQKQYLSDEENTKVIVAPTKQLQVEAITKQLKNNNESGISQVEAKHKKSEIGSKPSSTSSITSKPLDEYFTKVSKKPIVNHTPYITEPFLPVLKKDVNSQETHPVSNSQTSRKTKESAAVATDDKSKQLPLQSKDSHHLKEPEMKSKVLPAHGDFSFGDMAVKIVNCRPGESDIMMDIEWEARADGSLPANSTVSSKIVRIFNPDLVIDFYEQRVKFTLKGIDKRPPIMPKAVKDGGGQSQQQFGVNDVKNEYLSPTKERR